ncbi:hypothetical protein HDU93_004832 [Gonapodya sp. JEL0774]|nr:hypothetical protein HDU93_004832 [Gonapodya sp. JEL0774]
MLPSLISPPALVSQEERPSGSGIISKTAVRHIVSQQQSPTRHPPPESSRELQLVRDSPVRPATAPPSQFSGGETPMRSPSTQLRAMNSQPGQNLTITTRNPHLQHHTDLNSQHQPLVQQRRSYDHNSASSVNWHDYSSSSPANARLNHPHTAPSSSLGAANTSQPRKSMSSTYMTTATNSSTYSLSASASNSSFAATSTDAFSDQPDDELPQSVAEHIPFSTLSFEDDPDAEFQPDSNHQREGPRTQLNGTNEHYRAVHKQEEEDDFTDDALIVVEDISAVDAVEEVIADEDDWEVEGHQRTYSHLRPTAGPSQTPSNRMNLPTSSSAGSGTFTTWTQSWPAVAGSPAPLATTRTSASSPASRDSSPAARTRWRRKTEDVSSSGSQRPVDPEQVLARASRESTSTVVDDGLGDDELEAHGAKREDLVRMTEDMRRKVGERDVMREASLSDAPISHLLRRFLCSSFDFRGLGVDDALRRFLHHFELPRESQQIDRMMDAFSERYWRCNTAGWLSKHEPHVLSASLLMLNTDLYSPYIRKKMSREEFVENTKFGKFGKELPSELLEILYENIKSRPVLSLNSSPSLSSIVRPIPKSSSLPNSSAPPSRAMSPPPSSQAQQPPPLTPRAAFRALASLAWNPSNGYIATSGSMGPKAEEVDAAQEAERRAAKDEVARVMAMRAVVGVGRWDGSSSVGRRSDGSRRARSQSGATKSGGRVTPSGGTRENEKERIGMGAQGRARYTQISRHASLLGAKSVSREGTPGHLGEPSLGVAGQLSLPRSATMPDHTVVGGDDGKRARPRSMVIGGPSQGGDAAPTSGVDPLILAEALADHTRTQSTGHTRSASVAAGSSSRPFSLAGDYSTIHGPVGGVGEHEEGDETAILPWFDGKADGQETGTSGTTTAGRPSTASGGSQLDAESDTSEKASLPPPMSAIATRPPYSEPAKLVLDPATATVMVHQPPFRQVGRAIPLFAAVALRRPDEPGGWRLCTSAGKEFPFAMLGGESECDQWCAAVNAVCANRTVRDCAMDVLGAIAARDKEVERLERSVRLVEQVGATRPLTPWGKRRWREVVQRGLGECWSAKVGVERADVWLWWLESKGL